ncbi:potassium-transporting ATPase subunit KdpC [Faecalicatena contorta]|uniref:potassium-transporting ATPase subunit KdpC n=1 Tax=Faecalicatena contorta TaxID=39482 RepID=UPI00129EE04C|nr:potassium-transporting ATPase subunit KdpC [Faecalicatena contorta]MRM89101.1 potassium-transporting ATPase subunit KdpC [Faecalicatena contorta]
MKTLKSVVGKVFLALVIFSVLCGVIYPWLMTGISQLFFKDKANGSIIEVDGVQYGSELLGQQFTGYEYMWGRIMNINTETFTNKDGMATVYAGPSNKTPAGEEFEAQIQERVEKIKAGNPDAEDEQIPVDLVTCSGSGLDPHISVDAAEYQVPRLAKERDMTEEEVQDIIERYTTGRFLGIFGEKVVNVLQVNLALDGILK